MKEKSKKGKRWGRKWTRGKERCPGPTRVSCEWESSPVVVEMHALMLNTREVVEAVTFHLFLKHSYHRLNAVCIFRSTSLIISETNQTNRSTPKIHFCWGCFFPSISFLLFFSPFFPLFPCLGVAPQIQLRDLGNKVTSSSHRHFPEALHT